MAASRLGIAYSTLKRWVGDGRIRTTRTAGGHHRVAVSEIERLAAHDPVPARAPVVDADDALVGLSARNRLRGVVHEVRVDGLLAQVRMRIGTEWLTAVITADAVRDLRLRRGDEAVAVIKSTEVMVARTAKCDDGLRMRKGKKDKKGQKVKKANSQPSRTFRPS
ncbi:MAG TPA: TOBE domain-containing protein [Luteitalea sp.]|nr:TOBE domain-containing protein [Luteitalea sp.]